MDDTTQVPEHFEPVDEPKIPAEPLPPIQSRFLFVDVAALRAKQLRRGARPRLGGETQLPHKAGGGGGAAGPGGGEPAAGEGGRRGDGGGQPRARLLRRARAETAAGRGR